VWSISVVEGMKIPCDINRVYKSLQHILSPITTKVIPTGTTVNMCGGSNQAPINFNPLTIVPDSTLTYPTFTEKNGGCNTWVQFADDHAMEVSFSKPNFECPNFQVKHKGVEYTLLQFHFHSPAEHTVGMGYADAELHMVHKSSDGKFLVIGVLMDESKSSIRGSNNVFLDKIWSLATAKYGSTVNNDDDVAKAASFDWQVSNNPEFLHAYDLLPAAKEYWTYTGILSSTYYQGKSKTLFLSISQIVFLDTLSR
jgi:carbonic anhydrase